MMCSPARPGDGGTSDRYCTAIYGIWVEGFWVYFAELDIVSATQADAYPTCLVFAGARAVLVHS